MSEWIGEPTNATGHATVNLVDSWMGVVSTSIAGHCGGRFRSRRLIGFVPLEDFLLGRPDLHESDVMNRNVISVRVDEDIETVVKEMRQYDSLAILGQDGDQRMVGIITYDDVLDVMTEEATEDMTRICWQTSTATRRSICRGCGR